MLRLLRRARGRRRNTLARRGGKRRACRSYFALWAQYAALAAAISPFGLNTLRLPQLFRPLGSIRCACRAISPFGLNTLRLPRYFALRAQYARLFYVF